MTPARSERPPDDVSFGNYRDKVLVFPGKSNVNFVKFTFYKKRKPGPRYELCRPEPGFHHLDYHISISRSEIVM